MDVNLIFSRNSEKEKDRDIESDIFPSDPGAGSDHSRLAVSLCEQVGIEDCLDLQEEGDQLSQESLESLLTALHAQFSQAAPQPTSRSVFSTLIGRGMSRLGSHWSRAS